MNKEIKSYKKKLGKKFSLNWSNTFLSNQVTVNSILEVLYQVLNNIVGQQWEENLRCQQLQFLKGFHWLETVLRKRDT